jgi:hypothetical protein
MFCYFACQLKQIVVLHSTIEYISHNPLFENVAVSTDLVDKNENLVRQLRLQLLDLKKKVVAIKKLNPPTPVLLVGGEQALPAKHSKWIKFKVASFLGMLITICFRKRIFQYVASLK